eukprot:4530902-Prymnesium_polylepis.1
MLTTFGRGLFDAAVVDAAPDGPQRYSLPREGARDKTYASGRFGSGGRKPRRAGGHRVRFGATRGRGFWGSSWTCSR